MQNTGPWRLLSLEEKKRTKLFKGGFQIYQYKKYKCYWNRHLAKLPQLDIRKGAELLTSQGNAHGDHIAIVGLTHWKGTRGNPKRWQRGRATGKPRHCFLQPGGEINWGQPLCKAMGLNICITFNLTISLLGTYLTEMQTSVHQTHLEECSSQC